MNVRLFLFLCVSACGLMILGAILGSLLESSGAVTRESIGPRGVTAIRIAFFALFCMVGFSVVPIAVRAFVLMQIRIGNAEISLIRLLRAHEQAVVYGIWGVLAVGLCLAVPAAIRGGLFK